MNIKERTKLKVHTVLESFVNGDIEKFDAYGFVFGELDKRRITLTEICDIAHGVGLARGVIKMRRWQFIGMRRLK
tara:strand:+ start:683 stop:907 length:225 start_codon:yes stop_codon:yes gene_type:complete